MRDLSFMIKQEQIAITCTYDGVFYVSAAQVKRAKFKPGDCVVINYNTKSISAKTFVDKTLEGNYITFILDDNSLMLRNPFWNGAMICDIKYHKRNYFVITKEKE